MTVGMTAQTYPINIVNGITTKLKFWKNTNTNYKDGFISGYDSEIVFADNSLKEIIDNNNLVGKSIRVNVGNARRNYQRGTSFRFASLLDPESIPEIIEPSCQATNQPCHFIIDGQNLLGTLKGLNSALPVYEVISRLWQRFSLPPKETRFYICEDELNNYHIKELAKHDDIIILSFPKYASKTTLKRDADPYVLSYLGLLTGQTKEKTGLVLVGGDCDYTESLRLWLGLASANRLLHQEEKGPAMIVSSNKTYSFSPRLQQVAGYENVAVVLLEDII